MQRIPLIALTGGPCAGKSSAMAYLADNLADIGVTAVIAQEQATNYFVSGIAVPDLITAGTIGDFQSVLARAIMREEDGKREAAALMPGEQKVILCDRGILDNAAYVDEQFFAVLLHELGMSREEALARYDAVFHLVTAADGAPEHYNLDNEARSETPEEARELDRRTYNAWSGHEHLTIVANVDTAGNQMAFDAKLHKLYRGICHALGIPAPVEIERKFLMRPSVIGALHAAASEARAVDIRQAYLEQNDNGTERRIRARMQPDGSLADRGNTYSYTEKRQISDLVRNESSRMISLREYVTYEQEERDQGRDILRKRRYNFVDGYTYFHLDVFSNRAGLVQLEVEFTDKSEELILPDWLLAHVVREVTEDADFKNANIALTNPIIPSN